MHVFVTGASGFVGSAIVKELLQAGHRVLGLARSDSAAKALLKAGAEVHRGDIYDLESIKRGAALCEAVVHTAFNHDFSQFKMNCETDRSVILALGSVLCETTKPLVITSGIGLLRRDRTVVESDMQPSSEEIARAASEEAAQATVREGVNAYVVRLPPTVHGAGDHGFVPMVIGMAKEKGKSAYVGNGDNLWPAVHRLDAAVMYRLILEQRPEQKVFHAVAEEGVPFREIASEIGRGLQIPAVSCQVHEANDHFGWFTHFAMLNCQASSERSRSTLGWMPKEVTLIDDMKASYF